MSASVFIQRVQEMPDGLIESVKRVLARVAKIGNVEGKALGDETTLVEFVPDDEVVGEP